MGTIGPLFLGIGLPPTARDLLAAHVMDANQGRSLPGKPTPPDNWHITIRYFGTVPEVTADRLLAELDQADLGEPFSIQLTGLGAFPNPRKATVLWVGIGTGSEELAELNAVAEEAGQAIGIDPEDRPYRPHVTLSRLRPDQDLQKLIASTRIGSITFDVTNITLYQSHNRPDTWYEPLEHFEL